MEVTRTSSINTVCSPESNNSITPGNKIIRDMTIRRNIFKHLSFPELNQFIIEKRMIFPSEINGKIVINKEIKVCYLERASEIGYNPNKKIEVNDNQLLNNAINAAKIYFKSIIIKKNRQI